MSSITAGKTGYVRGPSHAQDIFGLENDALFINNPKTKFEHFVRFNIGEGDAKEFFDKTYPSIKEFKYVAALVKSATYPNISFKTELANQYNKKRHYYTTIEYQPITVVFHDVADGKSLKFWKMYYQYHFKNGQHNKTKVGDTADDVNRPVFGNDGKLQNMPRQSDFIEKDGMIVNDSATHDMYGLNLHNVNSNLLSSIELFFARGEKYERVVIVNPTISSFAHDTFSYEDTTGLMQITMTFEYETVIYDQLRTKPTLGSDNTDGVATLSKSTVRSLPNITTPTVNTSDSAVPSTSNVSVGGKTAAENQLENPAKISNAPSGPPTLGQQIAANVQGSFGSLGKQLSSDLINSVKTGFKTGNFKLTPNPLDTVKSVGKNVLTSQANNVVNTLGTQMAVNAIGGLASALNPIVGLASNATAFVSEGATDIANGITGSVNDVANSAFSSAASGVSSLVDAANNIGQSPETPPETPPGE